MQFSRISVKWCYLNYSSHFIRYMRQHEFRPLVHSTTDHNHNPRCDALDADKLLSLIDVDNS